MTASKRKIEKSLAERGRPTNWANEQEAAALSGFTPTNFRRKLPELESKGFPLINPINGMRFIPAINQFWSRIDSVTELGSESDAERDGPEVENFNV